MLSKYIGQDFSEHKTTGQHTHTNACVRKLYILVCFECWILHWRVYVYVRFVTCWTSLPVPVLRCMCVCILVCVRSVALIYLVNLLPHSREHAHKHIHNTHTLTNLVLLQKLWMLAIVRRLSRCQWLHKQLSVCVCFFWLCVCVCSG